MGGCDVNSHASLVAMASSCRLVVNCVGPFRYWGEAMVDACVAAKTHYIDVSGELRRFLFSILLYMEIV